MNRNYFIHKKSDPQGYKNYSGFENLKMVRVKPFFYHNIRPNKILLGKFREEKCKIVKSIIAVIFLTLFYLFFYFLLVVMISDIYQRYNYYIIKVWLAPSLLQLLIVRFLINYSMNVFKSYILFRHYYLRKSKGLLSVIVRLLISKEIVCMYKIRNIVTKYDKELKLVIADK